MTGNQNDNTHAAHTNKITVKNCEVQSWLNYQIFLIGIGIMDPAKDVQFLEAFQSFSTMHFYALIFNTLFVADAHDKKSFAGDDAR